MGIFGRKQDVSGHDHAVPIGFSSTVPIDNYSDDNDNPPPYEESTGAAPSQSADHHRRGPPRLHILGATWGGVNVTADVQGLVTLDKSKTFETLKLNMHTLHTLLVPDPAPAVIKTLTVLYRYDSDAEGTAQLLNAPQFAPQVTVTVTPAAAAAESEKGGVRGLPRLFVGVLRLENSWRDAEGRVEILAVLFGTEKVEKQSVLEALGRFFGGGEGSPGSGRRQQIRTTLGFFETRTPQIFVPLAKSWTVYFRLLPRDQVAAGNMMRVRCVTGMENGALEVPWTE